MRKGQVREIAAGLNETQQFTLLQMLYAPIAKQSSSLESYSGWLLAGFGGGTTFLLSASKDSAIAAESSVLRVLVYLLALSAVLAGVAKFLATVASTQVASVEALLKVLREGEEAEEREREKAAREGRAPVVIDWRPPLDVFRELHLLAMSRLARWIVEPQLKKLEEQGPLYSPVQSQRFVHCQAILVAIQATVVVGSIVYIAWTL